MSISCFAAAPWSSGIAPEQLPRVDHADIRAYVRWALAPTFRVLEPADGQHRQHRGRGAAPTV